MRHLIPNLLVLLVSCVATETGNPVAPVEMTLLGQSSDPSVVVGDGAEGLRVEEAWVVLGRVRFVASETCEKDDRDRSDWEGRQVFDLVRAADRLTFALADMTYCRVRIEFTRFDDPPPPGVREDLEGHSIVIAGRRGDGVPFVIRSREHPELEIRAVNGAFEIGPRLLLAFDFGVWMSGLDLDSLEPVDGMVQIDEGRNVDRLRQFEQAVEGSLELFRDDDENGELNDDERRRPLTEPAL